MIGRWNRPIQRSESSGDPRSCCLPDYGFIFCHFRKSTELGTGGALTYAPRPWRQSLSSPPEEREVVGGLQGNLHSAVIPSDAYQFVTCLRRDNRSHRTRLFPIILDVIARFRGFATPVRHGVLRSSSRSLLRAGMRIGNSKEAWPKRGGSKLAPLHQRVVST